MDEDGIKVCFSSDGVRKSFLLLPGGLRVVLAVTP